MEGNNKNLNYTSDPRQLVHVLLDNEIKEYGDDLSDVDDISILERLSFKWTKYDKQFQARHIAQLKPSAIKKHMEVIRSFAHVRDAALGVLRNDLVSKLSLFGANCLCRHDGPPHELKDIPYELFSWSFGAFKIRCGLPNLISFDFLTKQIPIECLENLKYRSGLDQLITWIHRILYGNYSDGDFFYSKLLLMHLRDEAAYLNLYDTLEAEIQMHNERIRKNLYNLNKLSYNLYDPLQTKAKALLEEQLNNVIIWNPIEVRYQRNWIFAKLDQYELRAEHNTNEVMNAINETNEAIGVSSEIAFLVQQSTYKEVEELKEQLYRWKTKFEREVEQIDGEIAFFQRDLHNLKESRKFQTEEIKRLQQEIIDTNILIERELNDMVHRESRRKSSRKKSVPSVNAKPVAKGKK